MGDIGCDISGLAKQVHTCTGHVSVSVSGHSLVICAVFEVLLEFVSNGGDWKAAISTSIPLRKVDSSPAPNVTVFDPHQEEEMTVEDDKGTAQEGEEAVDAEGDGPTEKKKKKAKKTRTYKRFLFHPYNLASSSEDEDSEDEEEKEKESKQEESEEDEEKDPLLSSLLD